MSRMHGLAQILALYPLIVGSVSACKTPFSGTEDRASLRAEVGAAGTLVTDLVETCTKAPRFVSADPKAGAVRYHTVTPDSYQMQPPFNLIGTATFANGQWHLSNPFGANPDLPGCLADRTRLNAEEFMAGLGCSQVACPEHSFDEIDLEQHASLWSPEQPEDFFRAQEGFALTDALQGYPFKVNGCEDPRRYFHPVVLDVYGSLRCKVDTLYSWGPMEKIDWMKQQDWTKRFFSHHESPSKRGSVFFTTNPIGSFGYGRYQIRVKLKSDVKFKVFLNDTGSAYRYCDDKITDSEAADTVIVRYFDPNSFATTISGLDFIICGPGPIDSWSYGTSESLSEILLVDQEYWKFRQGTPAWYAGKDWYKYIEYYAKVGGVDIFDKNGNPDSRNFTYPWYKGNVEALQRLVSLGNGGVYANPTGSGEANHFSTRLPFYFNQN